MSVCASRGWSFLPFCPSLPPAAPECTASCGLSGGSPTRHTLLTAGLKTTMYIVFFPCFVLALEWLRGSRQLGHFQIDHNAGGAECGRQREAFRSVVSHRIVQTPLRFRTVCFDWAGRGWRPLKIQLPWWYCKRSKPWFRILYRVVIELPIEPCCLLLFIVNLFSVCLNRGLGILMDWGSRCEERMV